ncbi:MAG TPA: type IV toxin-antitoxin system AbiEi family antitoxin domain-containing protein [Gemmatimonadaceae bacterium]|nr:type IV toxin-antitoxin system AbiEi family antitoxin domain-containing protein [Gemmatimonadaceae bacterium]
MNKVAKAIWNELVPHSPIFSTIDVMRRTGVSLANVSRDLRNLLAHGVVVRIRRGLWAVPNHPDFSPYAVVPHLFAERERGYVSLLSALSLHGMIEQIPQTIYVVTTSQRPAVKTPVGSYTFLRIEPKLFGGFSPYRRTGNFDIATPEKAVFDTLYFSARKGRRFSFLPEVELPAGFSTPEVDRWIGQVSHAPLRTAVRRRWAELDRRVAWAEEATRRARL